MESANNAVVDLRVPSHAQLNKRRSACLLKVLSYNGMASVSVKIIQSTLTTTDVKVVQEVS